MPYRFGGKKLLEDMGLRFFRNAGSVVADFNDHGAVIRGGTNRKRALVFHGIGSVVDEVGPNLIQFAAVREPEGVSPRNLVAR